MVNARQRPRAHSVSFLETLPAVIAPIFDQAQHTTANHRKNIVSLRKIQETCSTITESTPRGVKLVGEKAFVTCFIDMVNRLLPVKKGVAVADRVVKFIASYVIYTSDQDLKDSPEGQEDIDTTASRFVTKLLKHLLSGMEAKDKNVRFRVTLLTVSMINGLGELDDELFLQLRKCLLERARDKEVPIRVQATLGLAKLQSGEDEDDLEDGEQSVSQVLFDLLRYDPAAEVRKAALYNLPRVPNTMPYILARTRDVDPLLRRTVYQGPLSATGLPDARVLSIAQREEVVRNGLGDREGSVRKSTAAMLGGWIDQVEGDLVEFLNRFDVVSSQVAEEALLSVFVTRPEVFEAVEFGQDFWNDLSPEKAFLARVFVEHCISVKNEARLEDTMPVVTALAYRIQDEYNKLVGSSNEEEDDVEERIFLVGELLKLAINLDYADEIGRRKMFQLAREMLSQSNLPDDLVPRCLDILLKISNGERDLIRVVVDVVSELREGEGDEENDLAAPSEASALGSPVRRKSIAPRFNMEDPEERLKAVSIDMRCLLICISLLERVNSNLQENSVFHGLLPDLIIPAVRNKEQPILREQGLMCLGLCCMIDAKLATQSFGLFVQQVQAADDGLKVKVVQILFDLLMVHDIEALVSNTMPADQVVNLVRMILTLENPEVQAAACEGVAKLMLAGMISDGAILQTLVKLYFSPSTIDNQSLRQCLTYFIPVYCYSSPANQRRMLSVFPSAFDEAAQQHQQSTEGQMPPLSQIALMMIDWLDPLKVVERDGSTSDPGIHLDLAVEILQIVLEETDKDLRKVLVSLLGKLYLPDSEEVPDLPVKSLEVLNTAIQTKRRLGDAVSRNAVNKFMTALRKRYSSILEDFDEESFRSDERDEVKILFEFIDEIEEIDLDAQSETGSRKRSKRHDSESTRATSETPSDVTSRDFSDDENMPEPTADPDATPRKTPSRRAKHQRKVIVEEETEEDEEEDDEEEEDDDEDVESLLDEDETI